MHIPDGFLDGKTLALTGGLAAGGLVIAARQVKRTLPRERMPLMGLSAAFIFAGQMLNFPAAGGTSGHLLGGVLAGVLLGPGAAAIVMACVLTVQALLFGDGGVLALGANIFNMSFIGAVVGCGVYRTVRNFLGGLRGCITAVFFAAWLSTVMAAAACAGELAWSGTLPATIALPAMVGTHTLIGIGEGLITSLVILTVVRTRPELIESEKNPGRSTHLEFVGLGLIAALGLAIFVAPHACSWPDGLDKVAIQFGFDGRAQQTIHAWFADYQIPGVSAAGIATAIVGGLGTLLMFALACFAGRLLVKNSDSKTLQ